MKLPGDLSYRMPHENYYAELHTKREVVVSYRADDLSAQFCLTFEEVNFDPQRPGSDTSVRLQMFSDSWTAWSAVPDLFAALALKQPINLGHVTDVLDLFEATDHTAREHPGKEGPALKAVQEFRSMRSPYNARKASEALLAFAEDPYEDPPF